MADEILRQDKPQTFDRTGKAIWVQSDGAATPSGYDDEYMLPDDFLSPEQTDISQNQSDIADHETRITTLENGLTKVLLASQTGSFTYPQPNGSKIDSIDMQRATGFTVPVSAVGYTPYDGGGTDGEEILSNRQMAISGGGYYRTINSVPDPYNGTGSARTIYFQTTGTINVVIYLKLNLFT